MIVFLLVIGALTLVKSRSRHPVTCVTVSLVSHCHHRVTNYEDPLQPRSWNLQIRATDYGVPRMSNTFTIFIE